MANRARPEHDPVPTSNNAITPEEIVAARAWLRGVNNSLNPTPSAKHARVLLAVTEAMVPNESAPENHPKPPTRRQLCVKIARASWGYRK